MLTQKKIPHLRDYKEGIAWTLIDSLGSQGLVILYHLFFRTVAGASLHGAMGCLLSTVYLLIALSNMGLDKTIAPFLELVSSSKQALRNFLLTLWLPQILIVISIGFFTFLSYQLTKELPLISGLSPYLTTATVGYIALTFILESLRKIVRTFLQLSFYFELTTIVELSGISCNLLGIILLYRFDMLTLLASWQILALTAGLQFILLSGGMVHLYSTLSDSNASSPSLFKRFTITRFFSWAVQCLNQLYSGNFLVPICAIQFGIESASLMKVITSISYWITLLANRVFGITSNALLAHVKSRSPETQTKAFSYLSDVFNQGLSAAMLFLVINGKKIATLLYEAPPTVTWSLLYVMLLLTFFESFFVLYEKWYILEEDAHTYLGFASMSVLGVYVVARTIPTPIGILAGIISIRLLTFIALMLFSFYRWNIWPSFNPHWKTISITALLSGLCYLIL